MMNLQRHGTAIHAAALARSLLLGGIALLLGACSPDAASPSGAPKALHIGDFQLGTRLGPHGGIEQGTEGTAFSHGEPINVAMKIRDAPPGTIIKVIWKAPGGEKIGEESKRLLPGQVYMFFTADSENLTEGNGYQAEISANGKLVTVLRFDFV